MSASPSTTLRAALEDTAREIGHPLVGPLLELGRPLLRDPNALPTVPLEASGDEVSGGLAWGALSSEQLGAWLARVPINAVAAQVVARERAGARGLLDRVMLLPAREHPVPLEEVCTTLFLGGLGAMRVIELEARRGLVAVLGRRRF